MPETLNPGVTAAIRPLTPADARDYRAIRLAALRTAPEAFGAVHAVEAGRPMAQHRQRLASSRVFGAYDGHRIVGMIGLRQEDGPKDAHKAFLWGFFVEPACRGRGLGAGLLTAAMQAAGEVVEQVTVAVVADNRAAIALYRRFGFTPYGREPKALKTAEGYADELLMVCFVNKSEARS